MQYIPSKYISRIKTEPPEFPAMEPEMSEHSSSTLHAHEVEPLTCPEALEELFADHLADEAAIFASEVCSPNSHEWSEVRRSREECTVFQAAALRHFLQRWLPAPVAADGLDWPLSASPSVVHVGYFDSSLKGATHNSTSLEGNGLSVSSCPDAWAGGPPCGGHAPALSQVPRRPSLDAIPPRSGCPLGHCQLLCSANPGCKGQLRRSCVRNEGQLFV